VASDESARLIAASRPARNGPAKIAKSKGDLVRHRRRAEPGQRRVRPIKIGWVRRANQAERGLVLVSAELSQAAGRRREELSLNRGAVVLAVATWQTFVEDLTSGILDTIAIGATSPLLALIRADARSGLGVSTPRTAATASTC
jgi:hypothetical protein